MVRLGYLASLALSLSLKGVFAKGQGPSGKPNVLVIMTDDQDLLLDSLSVQPNVKSLIGNQGVTYNNFYCTVAWCCPSRTNYFTGRAAHNTNVTATTKPYGGWWKWLQLGLEQNYLGQWLHDAGLSTYYVGKFMNGFDVSSVNGPQPGGWTNSTFLVDPYTYNYLNSHWTTIVDADNSKQDVEGFPGIHTSTVTQNKGLAMIEEAAKSGNQWFIQIAPVAPHLNLGPNESEIPPIPPGYDGIYNDRTIPNSPNFNPKVPSGASWVYDLPRMDASTLNYSQTVYYHRLANLAYIDDIVKSFIDKLDDLNQLDNTYIIYTTDNGFHIGNHRLPAGKRCPYEEDINIPLLIRGPNVPKNVQTNYVTSHTDMAPTILRMLGLPTKPSYNFDGQSIPFTQSDLNGAPSNNELVNVEFWEGSKAPMGVPAGEYFNNTYKALRMISNGYSFMYSVWCEGSMEFYDMQSDPSQMQNRLANPPQGSAQQYFGRSESYLFSRLNALLMVMKTCAQNTCRAPWNVLFPNGNVNSLSDAMAQDFDSFFDGQPQVSFSTCPLGNVVAAQGPQYVNRYKSGSKGSRRSIIRQDTDIFTP